MRTKQQEGGHLQAKEKGFEETNPASTWIVDLQPSDHEIVDFCCLSPWGCGIWLWLSQQMNTDGF